MKIGILSDTHDHVEETRNAISLLIENGAKQIIHCGDLCAPFMIDILSEFDIKIHCVFGNIDDRYLTTKKAENSKNVKLYGDIAELTIGERKIFVNHFPEISKIAAKSQSYDAVLYGHTHIAIMENIGKTLLLNPGDVMGRFRKPSVAIYDTKTNNATIIKL
jgi:uncharacterized protein